MDKVYLSTVTPVYRGEAYLTALVEELAALRQELQGRGGALELLEAIFVDDASADGSARVLADLGLRHPWVRVVALSRNYGQHPATIAGILHSCGDWVATLDEDLQHRPGDLLRLLPAAAAGADVVYARPTQAVHESWLRDWGSRATKRLLAMLSGNPHAVDFRSFRLLRGSVARAAAAVAAHDTYFDVALSWFTDRVATAEVDMKDERFIRDGRSGYSLTSLFGHARRMLVSSQIKVLRVAAGIGVLTLLLAGAMALVVVAQRVLFPESVEARGWASLMVMVLFFGGLTALLTSIGLEYLQFLLLRAQGRPTFFVVDRSKDALLNAECGTQPAASGHGPAASETPKAAMR